MNTADFYVTENGTAGSLSDVMAFAYLKRRAAMIETDGEYPHLPMMARVGASTPTPVAAVH